MSYSVKEIYLTIQGEGFHTGKHAVFCRFSGCNLWTGLEKDRKKAICNFCDTDFVGTDGINGSKYPNAEQLANEIDKVWDKDINEKFVVFTGGEPLLQLDKPLVDLLHKKKFKVAIETNGTILPPENIDWICVSPKQGADFNLKYGNELKLVYPQAGAEPENYAGLPFTHFYLQPMYGPEAYRHFEAAREYCRRHPRWQLSLQRQKVVGIA